MTRELESVGYESGGWYEFLTEEITPVEQMLADREQQFENVAQILLERQGDIYVRNYEDLDYEYRIGALWKIKESLREDLQAEGINTERLEKEAHIKHDKERKRRSQTAREIFNSSMTVNPEAQYQRADQMAHMIEATVDYHSKVDAYGNFTYHRQFALDGFQNATSFFPPTESVLIYGMERRYKDLANDNFGTYAEDVVKRTYQSFTVEDRVTKSRGTHFDDGS